MNKLVAASSSSPDTVDGMVVLGAIGGGVFLLPPSFSLSRGVLFPRVHARKALGSVPTKKLSVMDTCG